MQPSSSDDKVKSSAAHSGASHSAPPEERKMKTPFPWRPMVAIAISIVTVMYTLCNLFPYAGYMVQHLGVTDDKDEAGFYAGYLSSAFMLGRFLGSYFWGRVADRYGRLPVMYIGLCSIAILSVSFGLSTTFSWAVACRFLTGALSGILATAKAMISEVCGSEHEVVGMGFVTGSWSVGLVLGSGIGGLLAEPASHYPTMFSESGLFGRFPYLLPNIFGASLALIGLPLVFFFLEETLDVHKGGDRRGFEPIPTQKAELALQVAAVDKGGSSSTICVDNGYDRQLASGGNNDGFNRNSVQVVADERLPLVWQRSGARKLEGGELRSAQDGAGGNTKGIGGGEGVDAGGGDIRGGGGRRAFLTECLLPMKLLQEKRVFTAMFVYVLVSFLYTGFDEAYPLWAISSVGSGGMDWTTQDVGQVLSACGGSILVYQLLVYPQIVAGVGPVRLQRWTCCVAIPCFLTYPFLPRLHTSESVLKTASLVLLFITSVAGNAVFTNISLATNNAVGPSQRGTVNGLSMMLTSLATAIGATVCATTFAWSIHRRRNFPLDHHLIFCLFALGLAIITATSWNVVISPVEPNSKDSAASPVAVVDEVAGGVDEKGLSSGS